MDMKPLQSLEKFKNTRGPVVLCILDGVACGDHYEGNAVANADTPNLDWLRASCPYTELKAHGLAVGMPSDGDMGNSEIGHNTIGSGRKIPQGATLVNNAIQEGALFRGPVWNELSENCHVHNSTLHFIGLFSIGNVHSHIDHLKAMLIQAKKDEISRVRLHLLLDGRDMGETTALEYLDPFEKFLEDLNQSEIDFKVASGGGRMEITMDRYGADWDMVRRGWDVHVHGNGKHFNSAHEAIVEYRNEFGVIDQHLPPFVIAENGHPIGTIKDNDSVILFNFRGDRAMELCQAFENDQFEHFDRGVRPNVKFAGMIQYDPEQQIPKNYLVNPPSIDRTMAEYLSNAQLKQLAVSETQKFRHITYFFNGNRSGKFNDTLEDFHEVPSFGMPFDHRPWMGAAEITDIIIQGLESGEYDFIRANYPNGDMIGHTGNYQAAKISVEIVDLAVGRLIAAVKKAKGILVVTADHGNADEMFEWDKKSGEVRRENGKRKSKTSHTLNPVPCYIYDSSSSRNYRMTAQKGLGISSLAATCLNLLGYVAPSGYDPSLIEFDSNSSET